MSFAYAKGVLICIFYFWTRMNLAIGEMEFYPAGNQDNSQHYALQRLASLLEQAHRYHVSQKQVEKSQEVNENSEFSNSNPYHMSSMYMNRHHYPNNPIIPNNFDNYRKYEENDEILPISMNTQNHQKVKPVLDLKEFEPFVEQLEEDNLEYVVDDEKPILENNQKPEIKQIQQLENRIHQNVNGKFLSQYEKPKPLNKNYGRLYANHHFNYDLNAKDDTKYEDSKDKPISEPNHFKTNSKIDSNKQENLKLHHFDNTHQDDSTKHNQHMHQYDKNDPKKGEIEGPEFTYKLPKLGPHFGAGDKEPPFAVGPNDPRYYSEDTVDQNVDIRTEHRIDDQSVRKTPMIKRPLEDEGPTLYVVAMIAGISAAATVGLVAFGIGWYTLQKRSKLAQDTDYPAYGVTGPNVKDSNFGNQPGSLQSPGGLGSISSADKRLAQSAQLYHYHHQKQQILAMENRLEPSQIGNQSDPESEEENDEGDYTVYECPGLAPTGEMEVKNPMFLDDPTPATPQNQPEKSPQHKN